MKGLLEGHISIGGGYSYVERRRGYDLYHGRAKLSHHGRLSILRGTATRHANKFADKDFRGCITCGHDFYSEGKHNRMCGVCRTKTTGMI